MWIKSNESQKKKIKVGKLFIEKIVKSKIMGFFNVSGKSFVDDFFFRRRKALKCKASIMMCFATTTSSAGNLEQTKKECLAFYFSFSSGSMATDFRFVWFFLLQHLVIINKKVHNQMRKYSRINFWRKKKNC